MAGSGLNRDWPSSGLRRGQRPGNLSPGDPQNPPLAPPVIQVLIPLPHKETGLRKLHESGTQMSPTLQAGLGILSPAQSPRSLNPSPQGPCPLRSGLSAFCTAGSPGPWDPELPPCLPGLQNLRPRAPLRYRPAPHSRRTLTREAPLALSLPRHSRNFSFQITLSKPWLFQKCELESCLRAAGLGGGG